ncbi:hypothetical protein Ancab_001501, partial [Ancistrocladus abbreviatus]
MGKDKGPKGLRFEQEILQGPQLINLNAKLMKNLSEIPRRHLAAGHSLLQTQ